MRGPPAPTPPAAAPSASPRLLPGTVFPAAGCPAHACPASVLRGGPASLADPWRPRGSWRPPGRTQVLLLERGEGGKVTGAGRPGHRRPRGRLPGSRPGAAGKARRSHNPPPTRPREAHPGVELTTATFSFSTERPFRGPVTATPSSSAFFRSSSISWEIRESSHQGSCVPARCPQSPEYPQVGPSADLCLEL